MSSGPESDILARIVGNRDGGASGDDPWESLAATEPSHEKDQPSDGDDSKLNGLLQRIDQLTNGNAPSNDGSLNGDVKFSPEAAGSQQPFLPVEPTSLRDAGLSDSEIESLCLKLLMSRGDLAGRDIAEHIRLPFALVEKILRQMKQDQLVVYRGSAAMNDYMYQLTDLGRERARRQSQHCTYFGAAPVPLTAYVESVRRQSLEGQCPTEDDLHRAFEDLLINPHMLARLGPAINSGRGLFLFGPPGNGKTSIAERVTSAFGQQIWIPRALSVDGEIMRLFDPMNHEEIPLEEGSGLLRNNKIDQRWVRIRRPTIVVGGELTMENLEVTLNTSTGISEAPVQLKSNCGTLVIDDFGRQRMSTDELLNRWIVPLEKRYDFLGLATGKKIQVPFDQLVIFSTNLEPRDLVDDAFLRRIPYKIEVTDPSESEFRQLFRMMCDSMEIAYDDDAVTHLIDAHYRDVDRPFRCCQPRDLLLQVRNRCRYEQREMTLSADALDFAVENYFAVM
jgi:predicted ATPase with chaperone activity